MRLGWAKTKYSTSYYVKKTIYVNGKNKALVIKRLGSEKYICETYGVTDAKAWAKEQVRLMNEAEKADSVKFNIGFCSGTDLVLNDQRRFNGGYLFLQDIYYELGLHKICRAISARYHFEYDLNDILSRLIYTWILYPSSKKSSFEEVKRFIEQPSFELHDIYRALSVISEESGFILSRLFKNSAAIQKNVIHKWSIMIVQTFILKLIPLKMISNSAKAKKIDRFRLSAWDFLWIWMEFRFLFQSIQATEMNSLP